MTVYMEYPAMTPQGRAGKRRWKGVGSPCRENGTQNLKLRWYEKPEPIVPILPWNSLRIFLKSELPVPKNKIYDVIQFFQWFAAENRKHYFRFFIIKNRRYDLLKNLLWMCYSNFRAFIEPWKLHDRLHGIPGDDQKESRKTPPRGGRKSMQRERYPKSEITLIRKTRTSSSDFALKFTSYFLKTGTTSS